MSDSRRRFGPILHDFRRTLFSEAVIIAMILLIALSLTIISLDSVNSQSSGNNNSTTLAYFDGSGYHFLTYSSNQYGQPLKGISNQFNLTDGSHVYSASGKTNSSGYSLSTVNAPPRNNYSVTMTVKSQNGGTVSQGTSVLQAFSSGKPQNLSSGQMLVLFSSPFSVVQDSSNSSKYLLQVFYAGPDGSVPDNYGVYYHFINGSSFSFSGNSTYPFTESQMQSLGTLNTYHQIFNPNISGNDSRQGLFWFGIFSSNGTALSEQEMSVFQFVSNAQLPQAVSLADEFFAGIMGLFIPLIVIMGAYSSYGKDRISGVLESVLSRPVTRQSLGLSRYISTLLGLSVATAISIIVVDVALGYFNNSYLSAGFLAATFGGFLVEIAAFTALIFLISHLVKTTGELLGVSIGLYIIFGFFWSLLIFAFTTLIHATPGSAVSIQVQIISDYVNPAQFVTLVYSYLTQSFSSVQIQTASYGLTVVSLVADGLLWIALPLLVFLRLATQRD